MLVTDLSDAEIILGKLAARLVPASKAAAKAAMVFMRMSIPSSFIILSQSGTERMPRL